MTIPARRDSLLSGLLGWWSFDEGVGNTVRDLSPNNRHGIWFSGKGWGAGKIGNGGSFDGSSSSVYVPANGLPTGAQPWTYNVWVKTTQSTFSRPIFWNGVLAGNQSAFIETYTAGVWICSFYGTFAAASTVINTGLWFMLTVTYDGATASLYTNGKPDGSVANVAALVINATGYAFIGGASGINYWKDSIDEVAVWNRALDLLEIAQLYNCGVGYQPIS